MSIRLVEIFFIVIHSRLFYISKIVDLKAFEFLSPSKKKSVTNTIDFINCQRFNRIQCCAKTHVGP